MKIFINFSMLVFLLVFCKTANSAPLKDSNKQAEVNANANKDIDKIDYVITIDKTKQKLATVRMSFIPKNDTLYMAPGGDQLPKRWATFVENLKAVDIKGNIIPTEELSDAKWKLQLTSHEKIVVSYEIRLNHEDYSWSGGIDGVAYATDWGVFYTGRSLFILNSDGWENIKIDFIIPSDWHVTTPFDAVKNRKDSFVVDSQTTLMQSMIFAGTHEEISFKRDDFELIFALGGEEVIAQKEEFKKLVEGVLDYYIELMGGIPNPSPNSKFNKSIVIINSHTVTDGEAIGNNISMLIEKNGNKMSKVFSRFMFAHEFFHLWNGKSFGPINNDSEWFKEGFSNYYTLKSLYYVGFLDDAAYFDILNSLFFQRYNNDNGVGKISMTKGEEKHDHWGLIYGGGLFIAISQDMIIRKATNNKKNVDDLMKGLFQKYGGTNDRYSLDELHESLSELSGKDQSEFFKNYISGAMRIPIDIYLSMAGLDAKIENGALMIDKKKSPNQLEKNMIKGLLGVIDPN